MELVHLMSQGMLIVATVPCWMYGTQLVGVDQANVMVASKYCLIVAAAFAIVLGRSEVSKSLSVGNLAGSGGRT